LANAKDELTQKPPNPLYSQNFRSAFVVSSILLLAAERFNEHMPLTLEYQPTHQELFLQKRYF